MADAESTGADAGMSASDVTFLVTCLQNVTDGNVVIDINAVGDALGYKNAKSVANKISIFKKKYGLAISSSGTKAAGGGEGSARKASVSTVSTEAKVPATPSKNRVAKSKKATTSKTAKGNAKSKGKVKKTEEANEEVVDENSDDLEVKSPGSDDEVAIDSKLTDDEDRSEKEV